MSKSLVQLEMTLNGEGSSTSGDCPEEWVDARSVSLGCLFFEEKAMSWWDALLACRLRSKDAILVEVFKDEQLDYLRLKMKVFKISKINLANQSLNI